MTQAIEKSEFPFRVIIFCFSGHNRYLKALIINWINADQIYE